MVWSSAASSMPSTTATKIRLRRCGLISSPLAAESAAGVAWSTAALGLVMPGPTVPTSARPRSAGWPGDALRRVQLHAQLVHQLQLRLQVVDVLFLVGHDVLEEGGGGGILLFPAQDDGRLEPVHHLVFDGQVGLELLAYRRAGAHREEALVVRQPVEQQDAVGDRLGVPHLVKGLGAGVLS